jgi:S-adenosylmethionine-dependent methyltransferase
MSFVCIAHARSAGTYGKSPNPMTNPTIFNQKTDVWMAELNQPWMRLRYQLVAERLAHHLPTEKVRVLDAGGGNGADSIPLAQTGHEVTLVDYSEGMLAEAQRAAEAAGVAAQMRFVQGSVLDLPALVGDDYDVVLSHNVLQYVSSLEEGLRAAVSVLKPGGWLSLILLNRYSQAYQAALFDWQFEKAASLVGVREMQARLFDTIFKLYDAAEAQILLKGLGMEVVQSYGLRCVNDYIRDNAIKYEPDYYEQILALERRLSTEYPYYLLGRFLHVMAQIPQLGK